MDSTIGMLQRLTGAAGSSLTIDHAPAIPTIAAAAASGEVEPNWTMFKATTDWVRTHPADAEIAISAAPDVDNARVANLAAAAAEMIASWAGLRAAEVDGRSRTIERTMGAPRDTEDGCPRPQRSA